MLLPAMASTASNTAGIAPASFDSLTYCAARNERLVAPLGHGAGDITESYSDVFGGVIGLLLRCSPSAILRAVAFSPVNSVNRVRVCWPLTHIGKKLLEAIAPLKANMDTFKAVFCVRWSIRLVTPLNHIMPIAKLRSFRHTMSLSKVSGVLSSNAATAFSSATSKLVTKNSGGVSALARTVPTRFSATSSFAPTGNRESSKNLTGKVNEIYHNIPPIVGSPLVAGV